MSLDFWRTLTLGSVAVGQTAFTLLYFTYPWWKSFLGRALFFKAVALAVLVDAYMLFRVLPFNNADRVFVTLYAFLAFGVWFQFFAFLKVKLQHRDSRVSGNARSDSEVER